MYGNGNVSEYQHRTLWKHLIMSMRFFLTVKQIKGLPPPHFTFVVIFNLRPGTGRKYGIVVSLVGSNNFVVFNQNVVFPHTFSGIAY